METIEIQHDERGFFSGAVFTVALLFLLYWLQRSGFLNKLFNALGLGSGSGTGAGSGSYGGGIGGAGGAGGGAGAGGCCEECDNPKYPVIDFPTPPPQHPVLGYGATFAKPSGRPVVVPSGDPRLQNNNGIGIDNLGRKVVIDPSNEVLVNQ